MIKMENQNTQKEAPTAPVSVNTQALAGVVMIGLYMLKMNQKMKIIINNQAVIQGEILTVGKQVVSAHADSVSVKEIIRLASNNLNPKGA